MLLPELKYSYNDVAIVPTKLSAISHRSECVPFDNTGHLPIFTAPMSCIVNEDNYHTFSMNKIKPILPRNISFETRLKFIKSSRWTAVSLDEFIKLFVEPDEPIENAYICIDVANGHMVKLLKSVNLAKGKCKSLTVMCGNIANPETIAEYMLAGVDYARLGIGSGFGCITSSNTGVHYPMASLIDECVKVRKQVQQTYPKSYISLVADGGIRNYNDAIKALALGADHVMIGGLFAQMQEACGKTTQDCGDDKIYREFYGMASAQGQVDLTGSKSKTSEGISKLVEVKYTLPQWTTNFESYLRSAMSYTGAFSLNQFKRTTNCILISNNTFNSVNK